MNAAAFTCPILVAQREGGAKRKLRRNVCMQQGGVVEWMTNNKAKISPYLDLDLENKRTKQGVRIVQDAPPIGKNVELLTIPNELLLSTRDAREIMEAEVEELRGLELENESWLALRILLEKRRGGFKELLASLPGEEEFDAGLMWTEEELEWIKGSSAYDEMREIREGVRKEWEQIAARFECSWKEYAWAVGIVDGRGVEVGDEIVLGGVLGWIGLGKKNVRVEIGGGVFGGKKLKVVTEDKVGKGEEVFLGFEGGKGKAVMERGVEYGKDVVEFVVEVGALDRFYEDKVDILESFGKTEKQVFELECEEGKWKGSEDMETMLRLVCLQGTDAFLLEGVFRRDIWDIFSLPISEENERALCDVMIGGCEDLLDAYTGPPEDGEGRAQLARGVVEEERKVLETVKAEFEKRRSSLDAIEYYAERRLKALDLLRPVDESEIVDSTVGTRMGRAFDDNYQ